jgi:hypothetical protein
MGNGYRRDGGRAASEPIEPSPLPASRPPEAGSGPTDHSANDARLFSGAGSDYLSSRSLKGDKSVALVIACFRAALAGFANHSIASGFGSPQYVFRRTSS